MGVNGCYRTSGAPALGMFGPAQGLTPPGYEQSPLRGLRCVHSSP